MSGSSSQMDPNKSHCQQDNSSAISSQMVFHSLYILCTAAYCVDPFVHRNKWENFVFNKTGVEDCETFCNMCFMSRKMERCGKAASLR
jgi:hypothetical protein